MIANTDKPNMIPGVRKAALLMVVLGDQASAEVLKNLEEDEVAEIGREVARLPIITSEQAEAVLDEFYQMIVAHDYVLKGGVEYARKMLINGEWVASVSGKTFPV